MDTHTVINLADENFLVVVRKVRENGEKIKILVKIKSQVDITRVRGSLPMLLKTTDSRVELGSHQLGLLQLRRVAFGDRRALKQRLGTL